MCAGLEVTGRREEEFRCSRTFSFQKLVFEVVIVYDVMMSV